MLRPLRIFPIALHPLPKLACRSPPRLLSRPLSTHVGLPTRLSRNNPIALSFAFSACLTCYAAYNALHAELGGTAEGLRRSMSFYSLALPTYARYKYLQRFEAGNTEMWDALDEEASKKGLEKILELRGFYIKTGQMCATNIGSAFPKKWSETMSILQDGVPPKPVRVVESTMRGDGLRPEDFELGPVLGSASIGQVHSCVHGGRRRVVKVQYPEVRGQFESDVKTLILFCKVAQPVHVPGLEEIERQFLTEFDYR